MQVLRRDLKPILNSDLISDFINSSAINLEVRAEDVDGLGHMNNAVYVNCLDQAHLIHTFSQGVTPEVMEKTGCGLVVRHTDLTYLAAIREGETACVGTCITSCDGKLRMQRQFQMVNPESGRTVLRGVIDYISIDYRNGRPIRMPADYAKVFREAVIIPVKAYQ